MQEIKKMNLNIDANIPIMVSVSGGRSSGMMAKIIKDNIPQDRLVFCFANTGKEHEETLKFVKNIEINFGAPIFWIEYDNNPQGFRLVDFASASRNGEPFSKLVSKRNYVPNVVTRFCTTELKIRPMKRFIKSLGVTEWYNAVGIRYDEPRRYSRLAKNCIKEPYETIAPLYDMRIDENMVANFWQSQSFDLELPNYLGNCDMCFLKNRAKIKAIIKSEPNRASWWIEQEERTKTVFRNGLPYRRIVDAVASSPELFDDNEEIECFCNID
ncbi:MAG: phosphoadenosine phosphosulfate reductase family protein [Saprospiraceae bacterium]